METYTERAILKAVEGPPKSRALITFRGGRMIHGLKSDELKPHGRRFNMLCRALNKWGR